MLGFPEFLFVQDSYKRILKTASKIKYLRDVVMKYRSDERPMGLKSQPVILGEVKKGVVDVPL